MPTSVGASGSVGTVSDPETRHEAPPRPAPRRGLVLRRLLAAADALAIVFALAVGIFAFGTEDGSASRFAWGLLTVPGWIVLLKVYGLYDRDGQRVSHATVDDVPWMFHAMVLGTLGVWLYYKVLDVERLVFVEVLAFFVTAIVLTLLTRALVRSLARATTSPEQVLVVGGGPVARLVARKVGLHPEYGLSLIGYLDTEHTHPADPEEELPLLGELSDLEAVCRRGAVERVLAIAPAVEEESLTDLIRRTRLLDVRISLVPDLVDVLGPSVEIDDIEGITVLGMNPPRLTRSSRALKRAMDISIASIALVGLLPVLVATAVAVRLTSPGPVLFSHERVGRKGRYFRVHKFRTMVVDAEERAKDLWKLSSHQAWLHLDHDPRITPVGGFLRLTSIDELPQLWNVLKGEMSLVGPRPMLPSVHEHVSEWGRRRLDLTPGITGLWQVLGRTTIPFEEMVKLDYLYVTNWSLWYDVRLLIRTLPAVLTRRGAN